MSAQEYIIVTRDTHYAIIGPFESEEARREWTDAHWNEDKGDPRWQAISLTDEALMPMLLKPTSSVALDLIHE